MDSGIGIGGLSVGQDEYASRCFDLFKGIEIENSIADVTRITTRPISVASSRGPFTFEIPADPEKFTDAESFRLHGSMRIRKKNAGVLENITATEEVSTVNNIFHSLWSKVVVHLNDVAINDPTNSWYAYKAYFENHLSYSKGTKTSLLDYTGFLMIHVTNLMMLGVLVVVHIQNRKMRGLEKDRRILRKVIGYTFVLMCIVM